MSAGFSSHIWVPMIEGMILHVIGGFWLLFAAYSEDSRLARRMVFIPALSLVFMGRHPRAAAFPCLLQLAGFALMCLAVSRGMAVANANG